MVEFKEIWPVVALVISIGLNFYQSNKSRENNRSDKETDAINTLNQQMHTVTNNISDLRKAITDCEIKVNDVGILKERIDNTKQSLTDLKAQMGAVQGLVQAMMHKFKPDN